MSKYAGSKIKGFPSLTIGEGVSSPSIGTGRQEPDHVMTRFDSIPPELRVDSFVNRRCDPRGKFNTASTSSDVASPKRLDKCSYDFSQSIT